MRHTTPALQHLVGLTVTTEPAIAVAAGCVSNASLPMATHGTAAGLRDGRTLQMTLMLPCSCCSLSNTRLLSSISARYLWRPACHRSSSCRAGVAGTAAWGTSATLRPARSERARPQQGHTYLRRFAPARHPLPQAQHPATRPAPSSSQPLQQRLTPALHDSAAATLAAAAAVVLMREVARSAPTAAASTRRSDQPWTPAPPCCCPPFPTAAHAPR